MNKHLLEHKQAHIGEYTHIMGSTRTSTLTQALGRPLFPHTEPSRQPPDNHTSDITAWTLVPGDPTCRADQRNRQRRRERERETERNGGERQRDRERERERERDGQTEREREREKMGRASCRERV